MLSLQKYKGTFMVGKGSSKNSKGFGGSADIFSLLRVLTSQSEKTLFGRFLV